jgi:hypothetical protein
MTRADAAKGRPRLRFHLAVAGPDDVVVARVDGQPVFASCVAAQAVGRPIGARAALDECIALELGAQEALRRALDRDPELTETYVKTLATALVDREVRGKVSTTADLPAPLVEDVFKKNAWRMHREEYRGSFFARIETKAPEGSPEDVAAAEAIRAAHATIAGRRDLFPADVEAAVRAAARPGQTVSVAAPDPATSGPSSRLQEYYHQPLFALADIGQVAAPVHGPYGWDLILYTSRLEPLERTREQMLDELFPAMRVRWFMQWTAELGKRHGAQPLVDDATLRELLGTDEERQGARP